MNEVEFKRTWIHDLTTSDDDTTLEHHLWGYPFYMLGS